VTLDEFENAKDALAELKIKAVEIQEHLNSDNMNGRQASSDWRKRAKYALSKTHSKIIALKNEIKKYRDDELEAARMEKAAKVSEMMLYQKSIDRVFISLLKNEIIGLVGKDKAKTIFSGLSYQANKICEQ